MKTAWELSDMQLYAEAKRRFEDLKNDRRNLEGLPEGVNATAYLSSTMPFGSYIPANANNAEAIRRAFEDARKLGFPVTIRGVEE